MLDRRIRVTAGLDDAEKEKIQRLSDLSQFPYVVLLGEPGMGKTTALQHMAKMEEGRFISVRAFCNGGVVQPDIPCFFDALDEYRSDGSAQDKIYTLAGKIAERGIHRWRLSCRAEDWHTVADLNAFAEMGINKPKIVLVQLEPLNTEEAQRVLSHLGNSDPEGFLQEAEKFGAQAFTQNPLSLCLLHETVSHSGQWPEIRFDLFQQAIQNLSHENNNVHSQNSKRHTPEEIIAAAGKIALLQLTCAKAYVWQSHALPPLADRAAYLTPHEITIKGTLLSDTLDTPLFRREGDSFTFLHRTLAEFLAAQTLAQAVTANGEKSRFPLGRALALITCNDQKPPSELRGVFAWLAVHLAQNKDHQGAARLAEQDAWTVLAYGDAASLDYESRRRILHNLDRDDPYFRASDHWLTVFGGLIQEDLCDDIIQILQNPPQDSHLLLTISEALSAGKPIPKIFPHLKAFVINSENKDWQRKQMLETLIQGLSSHKEELKEIFEVISQQPLSIEREEIRLKLAENLYPTHFNAEEIISLLAGFTSIEDNYVIGALFSLEVKLKKYPCCDLFNSPLTKLIHEEQDYQNLTPVQMLLSSSLVACIRTEEHLTAETLWQWIRNRYVDLYAIDYEKELAAEILQWLNKDMNNKVSFFKEILKTFEKNGGGFFAYKSYHTLCDEHPSNEMLNFLFEKVKSVEGECIESSLISLLVYLAKNVSVPDTMFWDVYDFVETKEKYRQEFIRLTSSDLDSEIPSYVRSEKEVRRRENKKQREIEFLTQNLQQLSVGKGLNVLYQYGYDLIKPYSSGNGKLESFNDLALQTNQEVAEAIILGWEYWAKFGSREIDIVNLMQSNQSRYRGEIVAIAGLICLIETHREQEIPQANIDWLILAVLRCHSMADDKLRNPLINWVVNNISEPVDAKAKLLFDFWLTLARAGNVHFDGLYYLLSNGASNQILAMVLDKFFAISQEFNVTTIKALLAAATQVFNQEQQIKNHCKQALSRPSLSNEQRQLWELLDFINFPEEGKQIYSDLLPEQVWLDITSNFNHLKNQYSPQQYNIVAFRSMEIVGILVTPSSDDWGKTNCITNSISTLTNSTHESAEKYLKELISNPKLEAWRSHLRHGLQEYYRLRREREFRHPSLKQIHDALAGKAPVNSADLFAIAVEELRRLREELHIENNTPWKSYWNRDSRGNATEPLPENECRNHLLGQLKDRLRPYDITAAIPEAQSAENTRVDILLLSHTNKNLPIEAKRHYNDEVWEAPAGQLQGYTHAAGAEKYGIYLVFWFGAAADRRIPPVPDGAAKPRTAQEMESMLQERLPEEIRGFTEVIVFDLANPKEPAK